jgi:hypothetical protein
MASGDVPSLQLNGAVEPTTMAPPAADNTPSVSNFGEPKPSPSRPGAPPRNDTTYSKFSMMSVPPEGSVLTGKQEHCKQHKPHPHGRY